jgi:hypothetical protein
MTAVAGIHAGGALNALELQAVANINAGGADLNAQAAIHTVAQRVFLGRLLEGAAGFATFMIIGNDQRVLVEHDALEAAIGTHVQTDLFTEPSGIHVGEHGKQKMKK